MTRNEGQRRETRADPRRRFLRTAAATGIVGIAGCADLLDERDGEDDAGNGDEPAPGEGDDTDDGETAGPRFDVRSLDPESETATYGDRIEVGATIENAGDGDGTQDVELRVGGESRSVRSLTLEPGAEETIAFDLETVGLDPDEHEYGVYTDDDGAMGAVTVDRAPLPETVSLDPVATGIEMAIDVAFVPDSELRYVASRFGEISVHGGDGRLEEPLLDLSEEITTAGDIGLLGVALHPEFAENGRLFVRYSSPPREGTPDGYSHTAVLSEFAVDEDRTRASLESERTIMETPNPENIHSSGDVRFGPDGYLYVPKGDGGFGTAHFAQETGTDDDLHGGILRIDVDAEPTEPPQTAPDVDGEDGDGGYAIPDDNPLVGEDGHRGEYFAWGLRNPWRTSFDGDRYFVGDVGEGTWEAVYLVEKGANLGWNVTEGSHCLHGEDCPGEVDDRDGEPLVDPIVEYPHAPEGDVYGVSVTGGRVYRGSDVPGLGGRYVFGDYSLEGRFFASVPSDSTDLQQEWETEVVALTAADAGTIGQLLSFAAGPDDELYALGEDGVYRIAPAGGE